MKKRSIGLMVVWAILTFGIYLIVWTCMFQGELKNKTGEGFGPIAHFFVSILTLGIYPLVWSYKVGGRLEKLGCKNNGVIYLIITLIGFGPIAYLLMQNDANAVADR